MMGRGVFPTRRMAPFMRGPLGALPQRGALVVVIGLLLVTLAARGAFANNPPVADAGPDQTVCLGEPVMLTGYAEDPDGDPIVCWDWAIDSTPEGSLADLPLFVVPDPPFLPDLPGDYVLSLVVTDGAICSLPDTVVISVTEDLPITDAATMAAMAASELATGVATGIVGWGLNDYCQSNPPVGAESGVIAVAAGGKHSLVLRSDGQVVAWGENVYGQCDVPALPAGLTYTAVAAGYEHSLALQSDGQVIAWGDDLYGNCNVPALPAGLTYTGVAAGYRHSLALRSDGQAVAWGHGYYGQCDVPALPPSVTFTAVAGGWRHSLALRSDGRVVAWGHNEYGQSDVPEDLTEATTIAAGGWHSLALRPNGQVVAWGQNHALQCDVPADAQSSVVAIAGGGMHSLALRSDGTVIAWGSHSLGRCDVPALPPGLTYSAIAAGGGHSLALRSDGTVVACGSNGAGQCNVPVGPTDDVAISAGYHHSLALQTDGTIIAWGQGNYCNVPALPAGVTYTAIDAGYNHSLALRSDGQVVAWGTNDRGQCDVPALPAGMTYTAVAAGGTYSLGLRSDGQVVAWGWNHWGQCNVPYGLTDVVAIASGGHHCLALRSDGKVFAWGLNTYGQCNAPNDIFTDVVALAGGLYHSLALQSDGTIIGWGHWSYRTAPALPAGLTYTAVSSGGLYHSLALRSDGQVVAWGQPYEGQCNVPPEAQSGVIAIAAGYYHSLALRVPNEPPIADAGPDQLIEAAGPTTAFTLDGTGSWDPDGDPLTYSWEDAESNVVGTGTIVPLERAVGEHPFTLTVTDPGGLSSSDAVIIWIRDTTPPTITAPPDVEVEESDPLGTPVDLGEPTVSDNCDPNPTVENDAPALFPLGVTTVTWTATDAAGNSASVEQMVTVVPGSPDNQLANLRKFILYGIASGDIAPEMEESLLAKVDAAIAALNRGDPPGVKVVLNDLKALVNQVEAQTDKKIETATAAEITERANSIIAALGG